MLRTMPIAIRYIISEVPPWLMKTKGTPVSGNTPVTEAICMNDCTVMSITIPETRSPLNRSGVLLAIRKPRRRKTFYFPPRIFMARIPRSGKYQNRLANRHHRSQRTPGSGRTHPLLRPSRFRQNHPRPYCLPRNGCQPPYHLRPGLQIGGGGFDQPLHLSDVPLGQPRVAPARSKRGPDHLI